MPLKRDRLSPAVLDCSDSARGRRRPPARGLAWRGDDDDSDDDDSDDDGARRLPETRGGEGAQVAKPSCSRPGPSAPLRPRRGPPWLRDIARGSEPGVRTGRGVSGGGVESAWSMPQLPDDSSSLRGGCCPSDCAGTGPSRATLLAGTLLARMPDSVELSLKAFRFTVGCFGWSLLLSSCCSFRPSSSAASGGDGGARVFGGWVCCCAW
mmetsp:Transcript_24986/g.79550  ORF Transcript_24986/g.79550 Transcript_24986/m.79550 type:complete len:209 (+) Transcript_24986:540-1166(+)